MDNIQCTFNIDDERKIISLNGLSNNPIKINFDSDINFTELVSILTGLIDNSNIIELSSFESTSDEKLNLVMETISGIIGKYDDAISGIIEKYNDAISENELFVEDYSSSDDLPF